MFHHQDQGHGDDDPVQDLARDGDGPWPSGLAGSEIDRYLPEELSTHDGQVPAEPGFRTSRTLGITIALSRRLRTHWTGNCSSILIGVWSRRRQDGGKAVKNGRSWPIGTDEDVAWIADGTASSRAITSAIPPVFPAYATVVVDELSDQDDVLIRLLSKKSAAQPWWLGYLGGSSHLAARAGLAPRRDPRSPLPGRSLVAGVSPVGRRLALSRRTSRPGEEGAD